MTASGDIVTTSPAKASGLPSRVPETSPGQRSAIVIGAGLAGMAAAMALEEAGWRVTLLEARRSAGGRAGSFADPETGQVLDNCQHVLLGCCTALIAFYRRLGVLDRIDFERTIRFVDGRRRSFGLWGLRHVPAPLHLLPALAGLGMLGLRDRIALAEGMAAMRRLGPSGRGAWVDRDFGQWLGEHEQPPSLVEAIYAPLVTSALNMNCRTANAAYAIQVFQEALLHRSDGYVLGLPTCPLEDLYSAHPCRDMRLGARVSELRMTPDGHRVAEVALASGETLRGDVVVLATAYQSAQRLVPIEAAGRDERFAHLERLGASPILAAHLWFDRPVLRWSHAALLDGPLQWIFRKDDEGRAVHGVISAADEWVDQSREAMTDLFVRQLRRILPAARDARLLRHIIILDRRATFAATPGVDRWRPAPEPSPGGIENLYLAGDYTQTGWPATMEGAVRSGFAAAHSILHRSGAALASAQCRRNC